MRGVFHTISTTACNPSGLRTTPALSRALECTGTNRKESHKQSNSREEFVATVPGALLVNHLLGGFRPIQYPLSENRKNLMSMLMSDHRSPS